MATSWEILRSVPLFYYQDILDNADLVMFPYMFPDNEDAESRAKKKREQLKYDLEIARLLIKEQAIYELQHQKNENLIIYLQQINKCTLYLAALESREAAVRANLPQPQGANTPVVYLGFSLGKEIADQIKNVASGKTKHIKTAMGRLNEKRLYWIWGSSLLKTVLASLPEDFFNSQRAGGAIRTPDPYTSCLSWLLYLSRFSLNLGLLVKHTLPWWLTKEEQELHWTKRFKTQWDQRKFTLMNDSLWGMANLLCAVWLTGKGALGSAGDALTVVLLAFDITVSLWDFLEQQEEHTAKIEQIKKDIDTLINKRIELESKIFAEYEAEEKRKRDFMVQEIVLQLTNLEQAQAKAEKNWELNKYGLYNNIGYAVGLMLAFVLLTTPFMPIPAVAAAALGIAGAVLCFTFTVITGAVRSGLEIHKTHFEKGQIEECFMRHIGILEEMLRTKSDLNDNEKRFLYLEIKKLHATSEYQRDLAMYQTISMVRSIIIDALIPALIFSTLVFLPLGIGLGALGGVLGLAIASHFLINNLFKPDVQIKKLPEFNEEEYTKFCDLAQKEGKSSNDYHTFFRKRLCDAKFSARSEDVYHEVDAHTPLLSGGASEG